MNAATEAAHAARKLIHPDEPITWPPKLRNMACELYLNPFDTHQAKAKRLAEVGLAERLENGRIALKPNVREAMKRMFANNGKVRREGNGMAARFYPS